MPRRLIDGMEVFVDEENAPVVGVDIEDVLYEDQEAAGTIDCRTAEEYEQCSLAYTSAQKLLTLLQSEGYPELMKIVAANAARHAEADRRYTRLDPIKMQGLRMDRIAADYVETFLTNLIEDAKATPRPILAQ